MFRIAQVFNNGVALVDLDNHLQAVAKGRGIAFQKKKGDLIDPKQVDKLFTIESETSRKNLYFLLKDIPIDVVTTTYEIINMAQRRYQLKVLDYIYITMSDHIYGVYRRYMEGKYREIMVPDFQRQYPTEYAAARQGVQILNRNLEIKIPNSETKNLALHFINAYGDADEEKQFDKQNNSQLLSNIVKSALTRHNIFRSNSNGNYYDRLMIHLQYLVDRIWRTDTGATTISPRVFSEMEKDYPRSYAIAIEIFNEIQLKLYPYIGEDELFYFIVHIQRIIFGMPLK